MTDDVKLCAKTHSLMGRPDLDLTASANSAGGQSQPERHQEKAYDDLHRHNLRPTRMDSEERRVSERLLRRVGLGNRAIEWRSSKADLLLSRVGVERKKGKAVRYPVEGRTYLMPQDSL